MAAARGQATRGWLELRDAVLARWRVVFVLAPLALLAATANADEQAAKKLPSSGSRPAAPDATVARLHARAPSPAALPPQKQDEAIEPPAFAVKPTSEETVEAAPAFDTTPPPELDPPAIPTPALSLEVPERQALVLPRRAPSVLSEQSLLSPAPPTPTVSEEPLPLSPAGPNDGRSPPPDLTRPDEEQPTEVDVLSLIRMEIKQRLPYFEGCARSARRRNGLEVRRLQATWAVAADGSIKDMKVDGIDDPELGACIVRIGSRPFTVRPGVDLLIPTPIVFVR
jgi:hypothetical protein